MVNTLKDKDLPQPWFGKKTKELPVPKQTRAASKLLAAKEILHEELQEEPSTRPRQREKGKTERRTPAKGKKKAKSITTGTADVLLGRSKNPVPDPEELRRKRIEDAVACGRVVKTISNPAKRQSGPTTPSPEASEKNIDEDLATAGANMDSHTLSQDELIQISGGTYVKFRP